MYVAVIIIHKAIHVVCQQRLVSIISQAPCIGLLLNHLAGYIWLVCQLSWCNNRQSAAAGDFCWVTNVALLFTSQADTIFH